MATEERILTEIPQYKVTVERPVPRGLEDALGNAGLPRANVSVSREKPEGTEGAPSHRTVLQQHCDFFDEDHDNVIRPFDTYRGFRRLGFNILYSLFSMTIIHIGFSYVTQNSWIPFFGNPFFKIYIDKIHKCKHGSDSETYDTEGRFVPEKFEEIFSKYDKDGKNGLTFADIRHLLYGNANVGDIFGWIGGCVEWGTLYMLCAQDGIVSKEDVRSMYDGSLFNKVAASRKSHSSSLYNGVKPGFDYLKDHAKDS
ncbi:15111_t:CDS:2 [Acaulospora morrowiae]|uniref:15111_t:CDS:1 n=1 Tax=Acaulospora morrowiae TaxID=94023 RepID=A0A9N9HL76_9GLOM|nr:15111_t:CDS:2 [Acaulospora morrowiae]